MRVKIRGGTAPHGQPSLCLTCRFATIVKGASLRNEIVECAQLAYGPNRIEFTVNTCTEYSDRRQPSQRASRSHIGRSSSSSDDPSSYACGNWLSRSNGGSSCAGIR
jgi:hypothetical protein